MQIDNNILKNSIEDIQQHLNDALNKANELQTLTQNVEGDSDLFRKLSSYLTPNLNHWVNGLKAGNMKDLNEVLKQRTAPTKKK